jgi:hypothetical protein
LNGSEERRMKKLVVSAVIAAAMAIGGAVNAQENVVQEADRTEYKKKTIIDFSDVTIQGELTKPEGSYLLNRKKTNFRSLLKIRGNFLPELFNSIDNL